MSSRIVNLALTAVLCVGFALAVDAHAASTFRVSLTSSVNSKTAQPGQRVTAKLLSNLRSGKVHAKSGDTVIGSVMEASQGRRFLMAEVSPKRWLQAGGGVGIVFTEVKSGGKTQKIQAIPIAIEGSNGVVVSKDGALEQSKTKQLKSKVGRTAFGAAALLGAPLTSVVGGVTGAAKPGVVLPEASTKEERKHRRLKGFATGFVAGLPGGFLVNDAVLKGKETVLRPGSILVLQETGR